MAMKWTEAKDAMYDKAHNIKEDSAKDKKVDAEHGVKDSDSKSSRKRMTADQANRIANFVKQQSNGGPAQPTPKDNPVTTDDDSDQSQGA